MIQSTSPVAASRKWLRISGGRIFEPGSRPCCIPPRESQIASRTNPPPAVTIQATSAAHFIDSASFRPSPRTRRQGGQTDKPCTDLRRCKTCRVRLGSVSQRDAPAKREDRGSGQSRGEGDSCADACVVPVEPIRNLRRGERLARRLKRRAVAQAEADLARHGAR